MEAEHLTSLMIPGTKVHSTRQGGTQLHASTQEAEAGDCCKFKVSLGYTVSLNYMMRPYLKKQKAASVPLLLFSPLLSWPASG